MHSNPIRLSNFQTPSQSVTRIQHFLSPLTGFEMLVEKRWEGDFLPFGSITIGELLVDLVHERGLTVARTHFAVEVASPAAVC